MVCFAMRLADESARKSGGRQSGFIRGGVLIWIVFPLFALYFAFMSKLPKEMSATIKISKAMKKLNETILGVKPKKSKASVKKTGKRKV
jgi:hypothetical protein